MSGIQVLAVLFQAACAGQFLAGAEAPVRLHEFGGWAVVLLGAILLLVATACGRAAACPMWIPIASAGMLLAELLQLGAGYGRFPAVHVPLGVLIFGIALYQAVWILREPGKAIL